MRTGRQVLITREISMPSFRQARGADSSLEADMMSTFALGQMLVRRSGYGAMQLAGPYAFGPPPDRAPAIGVLQAAVAAGVDHIDTAHYYGPGTVNDLIREALHPYPGGLAIVSKVAVRRSDDGAVLPSDDPHQLREDIEDNLRSLRVGQLAAVNLRLPGDGRVDARFDDQLAAMVAARDQGLIAGEGLSHGIAFVPFCPLGWPRGQENRVLTSQVVIETAARLGITPAQVALQWLLQLAPNVLLIPGTRSVAHLRENLAAGGVTLDDEALRQLDAVAPWPDDPSRAA